MILGLLRAFPVWVWIVVAALGWAGIQQLRASHNAKQAAQQKERAEQAESANRRAFRVQEITDAATIQKQAHVAAVRRGDAAGNGLRLAAQALAAPDPAGDCKAATDRAAVLADLFGVVEQRGREMARIADERGAAGATCERIATIEDNHASK